MLVARAFMNTFTNLASLVARHGEKQAISLATAPCQAGRILRQGWVPCEPQGEARLFATVAHR